MATNVCKSCLEDKLTSEFYLDKRSNRPRTICKVCHNQESVRNQKANWERTLATGRNWNSRNKEKLSRYNRKKQLLKYDLDEAKYNELLKSQDGTCAICKNEVDETLAVDHNHITGLVRGLLCGNCNNGLGRFKDNIVVLQNAIDYLKREAN